MSSQKMEAAKLGTRVYILPPAASSLSSVFFVFFAGGMRALAITSDHISFVFTLP
jgi:hypothetical protein